MVSMFENSKFNKDISDWKIKPDCKTGYMFDNCNIPTGYKPFKDGTRIE